MRRSLGLAALAVLCVLFGAVGSADALITGAVRVSPFTPTTSEAKSLTATCPAGTKVIGAGGDTTPGNGRVLIDRIQPDATLTRVSLRAREDETGTPDAWFLQAFVICATPPPGLELVSATSGSNSADKSVAAACPGGKRLLGSGAAITGAAGQVLLDGLRPNPGLTLVAANALEDETGAAGNWSVSAYAICANPVIGLERVAVTGPLVSDATATTAPCPAGKSVIGMGGTIDSPNGEVVLDALFPDLGLTSATISAAEDATGNSASWSLTAYAICAASAELVNVGGFRGTSGGAAFGVTCPAGRLVVGAGGEIIGGFGRLGLSAISVGVPDPTGARVGALAVPSTTIENWALRAQAICATGFPNQVTTQLASPSDSEPEKTVTVACPPGTRVLGAGGNTGPGDFVLGVILAGIRPNPQLTKVTALAREAEQGKGDSWTVTARAVCGSPPPGLELVKATSPLGSDEFGQTSASCPAGKHLIGTGGEVVGGGGEVFLDDLRADTALTRTTVTGFEDQTGFDPNWRVAAYAICINR